MTMSWIYLFAAGLLEIGWPIGLKLAGQASTRLLGISIALGFMAGSGVLLMLATRLIPIGTAYAIWTEIGAGERSSSGSCSLATLHLRCGIWGLP